MRHAYLAEDLGPVEREVDGAPQPRVRAEEGPLRVQREVDGAEPRPGEEARRLTPYRPVSSDTSWAGGGGSQTCWT